MQRISTLEVAHYGKNSQIQFLFKTICFKLGMVVQREKIRNKKNQPKKGVGRSMGWGEPETVEQNPLQIPAAFWDRGRQRTGCMRPQGPVPGLCGVQVVLPPTFLVGRVRGHMWVLGGLLDMEVHVVQLHVQADRGGWVTVHCGLETADWGALARTGRVF